MHTKEGVFQQLDSRVIQLSTTSSAPDALNTTFSSNIGADDTIVFLKVHLRFQALLLAVLPTLTNHMILTL